MRHQRDRRKLSRSASHRKALFMNLTREVIDHERIETTEAKAKAVKPEVERLITLAKRGDLHARRQALSALGQDKFVVYKLFEEIAPRYAERPGGYTRILKLGPRKSDATEMVYLELVRVVRPGGTVGMANWPNRGFQSELFEVLDRYAPNRPEGLPNPRDWGHEEVVRTRFDGLAGTISVEARMLPWEFESFAEMAA